MTESDKFSESYKEYLKLRRKERIFRCETNLNDPLSNPFVAERKIIKGKLANKLAGIYLWGRPIEDSDEKEAIEKYILKVQNLKPLIGGKTYLEIAMSLGDGCWDPIDREPSLAEAIDTSLAMSRICNFLTEQNRSRFQAIVLTGSLHRGAFFSVRSPKHPDNQASDIDLEIIIDEELTGISDHSFTESLHTVSPSFNPSEFLRETENFSDLFRNTRADYWSYKFRTYEDVKVSLHFTPITTVKKICQLDLEKAPPGTQLVLAEYRSKPKERRPVYVLKDFTGKAVVCDCDVTRLGESGQLTSIPQIIIDEMGHLHLGVLSDKILINYVLDESQNQYFSKNRNVFLENIARRFRQELRFFGTENYSLDNVFGHQYKINPVVLQDFIRELSGYI